MILTPLDRAAILAPSFWRTSPPVPVRERPVRVVAALPPSDGTPWRLALDAIPNSGANRLGYEEWLRVIAAIHHETQGSPEGLAIAQAWSARYERHDPDFLEARVWAFLRDDREGGTTGRTIMSVATRLTGWQKPIDTSGFGPVDERGQDIDADHPRPATSVVDHETRKGVPKARHKCTDQANANRLVHMFGNSLMVAAGSWYAWDGQRWARDEGEVYRMACTLSAIVKDEAKKTREKAGADPAAIKAAEVFAKALDTWSTKCEMKGTIEAALGLARKMLTVDANSLDHDPWLLCCLNGTVDLRTGAMHAHRREDRITKLMTVAYRPEARSEAWERVVREACCDDAPLASFLQRWWGYALTGSTREQKFVVLWGSGGNGKSVLVSSIDAVMGDYAGTAAAGLVAGGAKGSQVHSSAIVALLGKRLVTAHETGEGNILDEAFIKRATGSDTMDARFLFAEQFNFIPTHKLQLLTNYKPTIKGQDRGIWRRVLLVPFTASFGSPEDVAAGRARSIADPLIGEFLKQSTEREGILAWQVAGAMAWYSHGLGEPDAVRVATADYQEEQDRVGQFAAECCEVGKGFESTLGDVGMERGLYSSFVAWCKDGGMHPVAKRRFQDELLRALPGLRAVAGKTSAAGKSGRRNVLRIVGLRLVPDED